MEIKIIEFVEQNVENAFSQSKIHHFGDNFRLCTAE